MMGNQTETIYEGPALRRVSGLSLRPGGLYLTDRAVESAGFSKGASLLDVGCGLGTTVDHLCRIHGFSAMGVDPSGSLIEEGKKQYGPLELRLGRGEALPVEAESMEGVFNECTLSLMEPLEQAVSEVKRVLKPRGYWIISDLFAQNPEGMAALEGLRVKSCIRGMFHLPELIERLKRAGFALCYWEDHTPLLKELLVEMIFTYGSTAAFWSQAASPCFDGAEIDQRVRQCKPGYFLMMVQKTESG